MRRYGHMPYIYLNYFNIRNICLHMRMEIYTYIAPGGHLPQGIFPQGISPGGFPPGGFSPREFPPGGPPSPRRAPAGGFGDGNRGTPGLARRKWLDGMAERDERRRSTEAFRNSDRRDGATATRSARSWRAARAPPRAPPRGARIRACVTATAAPPGDSGSDPCFVGSRMEFRER